MGLIDRILQPRERVSTPESTILAPDGRAARPQHDKAVAGGDLFESSFLDVLKNFMAKHGPAFGALIIIGASGGSTFYTGLVAPSQAHTNIDPQYMWLLSLVIISGGLIVEGGFSFAWSRKGTTRIVGRQIATNDSIMKASAFSMMMDITLTVSTLAFSLPDYGVYWVIFGQPGIAMSVLWMYYRMKGEDPVIQAEQERAWVMAMDTAEEIHAIAKDRALDRKRRSHQREVEADVLEMKHDEAKKYIKRRGRGSFRSKIRKSIRAAIEKGHQQFDQKLTQADGNPYEILVKGKEVKKKKLPQTTRAVGSDEENGLACKTCGDPLKGQQKAYCGKACSQKQYRQRTKTKTTT